MALPAANAASRDWMARLLTAQGQPRLVWWIRVRDIGDAAEGQGGAAGVYDLRMNAPQGVAEAS